MLQMLTHMNNLNFPNTLAFENFNLEMNPMVYEYSDIDIQR